MEIWTTRRCGQGRLHQPENKTSTCNISCNVAGTSSTKMPRISVAKYLQVCIVFQHALTKWLAIPTVYLSQLEVYVRATCRPGLGVWVRVSFCPEIKDFLTCWSNGHVHMHIPKPKGHA